MSTCFQTTGFQFVCLEKRNEVLSPFISAFETMSAPHQNLRGLCSLILALVLAIPQLQAQLTRVENTSLNLPADLPSGTFSTTNAFPGLLFSDPVAILTPPGESNRLFIVEQIGRIAVIPDLTSPTKQIFLDIQSIVRANGNEEGLLGMAFHPNYNNVGQQGYGEFFVFFQTTLNGNQRHWRLSRFNVSAGDPNVANAGSEQPMISQFDQASNHNGGDLHFGDDGYLYIATGDEGGANDNWDNGQHIDKDFYSAILRIDVDQKPENLVPNAHAAVHANTYRVPADNPFVGATTFNGSAVTPANVRTEIWATGLRNPWRMSFDRPTGRLFVADVGQGAREEINIMSQAVFDSNAGIPNYGWSFREGFQAFTNGPGGATPSAGFTHIDPIHEYPRSQGRSVTGGLVYRGSSYAELTGDYLFADYVTGRIWAMDDPGGPSQSVTQIATDNQIAGFGIDPLTGDVLLADDNSNRSNDDQIKRLVRTTGAGTQPPQFLSQTGAFSNLASLTPNSGIVPYGINVSFWSDNAVKTRWFSIPSVSDDMTWAQDENWTFPTGTTWIKHFELDLDRDNPGTNVRRLETRFLIKTSDDVYGVTYRWNEAQTDAELVAESGATQDFDITDGGQTVTQTWKYPSRTDCRTCHTSVGGFALGFNTRQMNRDYAMMGPGNQIAELENAGYFTNNPPDPATLAQLFAADDNAASLEDRARSYLAANCVQCHQPGGPSLGNWDARPHVPLASAGIVDGLLVNNGGNAFNRFLVPGSAEHSMVIKRLEAIETPNGLAAMPPVGSCVKNQEAIDLLSAWIGSMRKILFVRGSDRSGGFLEAGNDAQRTEHLADITNYSTSNGNHGWGELADTLTAEGFLLEQLAEPLEGAAPGTGQTAGEHLELESLNLDQYCAIVLGSNNAVYDTAAIDALEAYVRGGGSALFISDANFGSDWCDAPNSDQQFLDRFGLIMNQDQGTYTVDRAQSEFIVPDHPIFAGVNTFMGEGVSPGHIPAGAPPAGVTITRLAAASGNTRNNDGTPGVNNCQGSSRASGSSDGSLVIASADSGKVAIHFDRNTFFNLNGAGTDINEHDNQQYARNLFDWLCSRIDAPTGISATDGTILTQVDVSWNAVSNADSYEVWRHTVNDSAAATRIADGITATTYSDTTAAIGVDYFYWIKAVGAPGVSGFSSSNAGWRGIAVPGNLAADFSSSAQVSLSWDSVGGAANYRVFRGTTNDPAQASQVAQVASTTYADTSANPGQLLFWFVRAAAGTHFSNFSADVSGRRLFPAPQNPNATQILPDRIDITWTQVPGQVGNYEIRRSATNNFASATLLAEPAAAATSFSDNTAPRGIPQFYWIRAESATTQGDWTAAIPGFRLTETFAEFVARFNLTGNDAAADGDPDLDDNTTFEEWAQGGSDPTNSSSAPPLITEIRSISSTDYLTISYLRFIGGTEAGPTYNTNSATYLARGALTPGTWTQTPIAIPPPAGLPAPPTGFEWGSFRLPVAATAADEGFLQLQVTPPAP